ncbi:MAG: D-Ala-D-Ala carboxypeptidase family metallohydrolase, partial [Pseudomonadota bacterium]
FIDAKPEMLGMEVSPNFTLGQFLCKQQPGHEPTYVLIRPAMLAKLEAVLDIVQSNGHDVGTLTVMSGFRTPWYNTSIGNRTASSRHLYGGAADVFVDANGDGWMDDLTGDGDVDIEDARALARWAEDGAQALGDDQWLVGGLGVYAANAVRGPFVHIDARGYKARW